MPAPAIATHMTVEAKDEMSRAATPSLAARRAEIAAVLRFADGVLRVSGQPVVRVELDLLAVAQRLRKEIFGAISCAATIQTIPVTALRPHATFVVQLGAGTERLIEQVGLRDKAGGAVQGLPVSALSGDADAAAALWRGAFLAAGNLAEPNRGAQIEIACPGLQPALALINAARRLDVKAAHRARRGTVTVVVTGHEDTVRLLTAMGAGDVAQIWLQRWQRRQARIQAVHGTNYAQANVRRAARAGVLASKRAQRALEIVGEDAPEHLRTAGRLRVDNQHASLDDLGNLYDPPISKDAVAGRIRRLLDLADKRARRQGIPGTGAAVADDFGDDDELQ